MLYKSDEAVNNLTKSDNRNSFKNVECWIRREQDYNLYVFSVLLENELELESMWVKLTNAIAVFFQSNLEKEIEMWNIYILFLVRGKVSRDLKYKIEQDKYSTRKIVLDNIDNNTNFQNGNYEKLIESRLFIFELPKEEKDSDKNNISLLDVIYENNIKLYNIITNYSGDKPATQFIKYLG